MIGVIGGRILLLTITGVAVLMDLYQMKIKNSWILFSMLIGFGYDLWRGGWNGTAFFISGTGIPLVVLGWLFYFRMLGSGDIKLFVYWEDYGTSTYSVVYLVCISDRRAAFTGHSDLVRRFQPANPIFRSNICKMYIRTGERKA